MHIGQFLASTYLFQVRNPISENCYNFFNELHVCVGPQTDFVWDMVDIAEEDQIVYADTQWSVLNNGKCEASAYHLHRISHTDSSGTPYLYGYDTPQPETIVFVLDTWIDLQHPEFEGRAKEIANFCGGTTGTHGTHVAGLIAGRKYGVNKNALIYSVPVLGNSGTGSWSGIVRALEYVATNFKPTIMNMSLGGGYSEIINNVVNKLAEKGWKITVSAGNEGKDACTSSPASASGAVTVAASDERNRIASFSNHGTCVDIVAPGKNILSAIPQNGYALMSGTSMASPITAGVWSIQPSWGPEVLVNTATPNIVSGLPPNTINRLVYSPTRTQC